VCVQCLQLPAMPVAVVRLVSWFRTPKIKNGEAEDDQCVMRSLE